MDVSNKTVVVTGASRGIGAEIAREFAAAGATVVVSARSKDPLASLAEEINGVAIPFDATDSEQVHGFIDKVENEVGSIDIFINNAGIEITNLVEDLTMGEIEETIRVNLITPEVLSSVLVPRMLRRGSGHLVYTSSIAATSGNPGMAVYCSSKGGLTRFAESLRMELRYTPLNVTILHLGPVDTAMWDAIDLNPLLKRGVNRFTKLGALSVADPVKVAKSVLKAVQKNKREVRLPRRMAINAVLNGIGTRLFEALLTGIRHREEVGKASTT